VISTANFASLASLHNFPLGKASDNHWGDAVSVLETTSSSPYYFNFHRGDLGNFTVIGPSGSGKTVVLTFLLAQAQRVKPRIVYFDKDRGAEIFLRAIGGKYSVLRPGEPTGFNPLLLPDTQSNRAFLRELLAKLLTSNGETLTADDQALIADAVEVNYAHDPALRRLRFLQEMLAGARRPVAGDLAYRMGVWTGKGDRAWLFDNAEDELDLSRATLGFDLTHILDDPVSRTPAMMYLFHRTEERMDGKPTIVVVDEGWKALDDEIFTQKLKDWEKTLRKRNGAVGFCTQNAKDALDSRIAGAIIEQSATQIFMPNPKAQEAEYCAGFGLTEHALALIRALPDTSRCFLIKHGADSVVARLDLSGHQPLLALLSGRESTVRQVDELRARLGDAPEAWLPELLKRFRGAGAQTEGLHAVLA